MNMHACPPAQMPPPEFVFVQPHGVRGARQWLLLIFIGHTSRLRYVHSHHLCPSHRLTTYFPKMGSLQEPSLAPVPAFLAVRFAAMAFLQRSADSTQVAAQAPNYLPTRPLLFVFYIVSGVGLPRTKCHWSLNVEAWDAVLSWPSHHKYPCLLLPLSMPTTNPHVLWSGEIGPRPSTFLDCDSLPRWHRRRACEY